MSKKIRLVNPVRKGTFLYVLLVTELIYCGAIWLPFPQRQQRQVRKVRREKKQNREIFG